MAAGVQDAGPGARAMAMYRRVLRRTHRSRRIAIR
jgi:hypothetical protein